MCTVPSRAPCHEQACARLSEWRRKVLHGWEDAGRNASRNDGGGREAGRPTSRAHMAISVKYLHPHGTVSTALMRPRQVTDAPPCARPKQHGRSPQGMTTFARLQMVGEGSPEHFPVRLAGGISVGGGGVPPRRSPLAGGGLHQIQHEAAALVGQEALHRRPPRLQGAPSTHGVLRGAPRRRMQN